MANDSDNQNKKMMSQDERNVQNNAKNIKNVADVAIASKNPYAMAAGGAVKVADKVTGGKASETLGSAMHQANKILPGGNGIQSLSNGLAESGLGNKASKASSLKNGMPTGHHNASSNNNSDNIPRGLKNRSSQGLSAKNRFLSGTTLGSSSTAEEDLTDDDYEENENLLGSSANNTTLIMKLLPTILPIIGILFGIILIVIIIQSIISPFDSFFKIFGGNSSEFASEDYEMSAKEQEYKNTIVGGDGDKGIVDIYREKYGISLDPYLLHAIIVYRYVADVKNDYYDDSELDAELDKVDDLDATPLTDEDGKEISGTNYGDMIKRVKKVADLMVINENGVYTTDNVVDGKVYKKLIDSSFLKTYYKNVLDGDDYESRKSLVDDIYLYAETAREYFIDSSRGAILSDGMKIHLQTCQTPYRYKKNENGVNVFNNPPTNAGTSYPDYLSMTNYLKAVASGELGAGNLKEEHREGIKAFLVTASTFLVGSFGVDFRPGIQEFGFPSGNCRQIACDTEYGCTYKYNTPGGYGTGYTGTNRGGSKGIHRPLNDAENALLDGIVSEIFGEIMVKKGVTTETFTNGRKQASGANFYDSKANPNCGQYCFGAKDAMKDSASGMNYREILNKYYDESRYDIINIKEGLYINVDGADLNYADNTGSLSEAYHYHQGDKEWGSINLCKSGSIADNGCNITSAAIAISILKNQRITPKILNEDAKRLNDCMPRYTMIMDLAKKYGLSAVEVKKNNQTAIEDMLKKISSGNYLAVARLASNSGRYKTSVGHYITIVGVKNENGTIKVLVWDPATSSSNRDNYWADLNDDILKYLQVSYSFILIGKN